MAEDLPFKKTYRLTLDFETTINTRVWPAAAEDATMEEDAGFALKAQRMLLEALLGPYRPILKQWIRQFVLYEFSEAQGTSGADIAAALNQRLVEEEALLEPVIQSLPEEPREYFLAAIDDGVFAEAIEDVWYSIDVALKHASLQEVGPREEEQH